MKTNITNKPDQPHMSHMSAPQPHMLWSSGTRPHPLGYSHIPSHLWLALGHASQLWRTFTASTLHSVRVRTCRFVRLHALNSPDTEEATARCRERVLSPFWVRTNSTSRRVVLSDLYSRMYTDFTPLGGRVHGLFCFWGDSRQVRKSNGCVV